MRIIENGLVPVYGGEDGEHLVSARELHEFLQSGRKFADWIQDRIDTYRFQEGRDFFTRLGKSTGGRRPTEYFLTADTAKEVAIVENNEQGRRFRRYLIEVEKRARQAGLLGQPDKERITARFEVIDATKGVNRAIQSAGGQRRHHINLQRYICRYAHGCEPKVYRQKQGIKKGRSIGDFEPTLILAFRRTACSIFEEKQRAGQIHEGNLSTEIREVPRRLAAFIEGEIGMSLPSIGAEPDIRPQVQAAKREQKRLAAPAQPVQVTLQL